MSRILKSPATRVLALVLAMLLLGGLLPFFARGTASPISSAVGIITTPLQTVAAWVANVTRDISSPFTSAAYLQDIVEQQEEEIEALREQLINYHEAIQRAARYAELLELKAEHTHWQFQPASVIGVEHSAGAVIAFTLNRGSLSGIRAGMPVIRGQNLVGVVAEVGLTSSTIHTILNPHVNVAVYETLSSEIGVATAPPELAMQGYTAITQLDLATPIAAGRLIATSGLGGIFPRNLIVGTVARMQPGQQYLHLTAVIEPALDFATLRDVFVLTAQ
ncbi:MAG: rod shape-determining protein MreC [Oscillospiraceae bacterium]|nr:rod shape-determining protein MreC [Oscillospiraceae bacterium]